MSGAFVERGHLGGYRDGGDPATIYEGLWQWLVSDLGVRSVLDVGCGEGQALDCFAGLDCRVLGVEGVPQEHPFIVEHDYTLGELKLPVDFDLAWCCEFVEHVAARYVANFVRTFQAARLLLLTHAEPGQQGYHHVHCRPAAYWVERIERAGFVHDEALTQTTRALAAMNPSPWNHFRRSGLAFRRAA